MSPADDPSLGPKGPQSARILRFGVFELDLDRSELKRDGTQIRIQDQPFRIISLLAQRAGELVAREELQQGLWPDDTFVDFDAGLKTALKKARQALGDDAENPRFIQTVPRRGYRFIAPVHFVMRPQPAAERAPLTLAPPPLVELPEVVLPEPVVAPASGKRRRPWIFAGVGAGLVLAAGFYWWTGTNRRSVLAPTVLPLTTFAGDEYDPSFSPDGRQVVFAWAGQDDRNIDLYLMETDGARSLRRLTTDPARDEHPAWSPDGRWIAFMRSSYHVTVISPLGGAERSLGEAGAVYLSWTPDSKEIILAREDPGRETENLFAVTPSTGEARQLTKTEERVNVVQPFGLSSDGRLLGYTRSAVDPPGLFLPRMGADRPADLFVRPASGGTAARLTNFAATLRGWTWIPGTHEIVFCSNEGGNFGLWRANADHPDREPQPIPAAGAGCGYPTAARYQADGRSQDTLSLAYEHRDFVLNLHELSLPGGPRLPPSDPRPARIVSSTRVDAYPQFSADGKKLIFVSDRSGYPEIWTAGARGENPAPLTAVAQSGRQLESPRWSPDGTSILFIAVQSGARNLYVMPAGGGKPRLLREGHAQEVNPSWSRDGRHVYFASRGSGAWQIWKLPFDANTAAVQITSGGGVEAYESEDGKSIYFKDSWTNTGLWAAPSGGGPAKRVIESGVFDGWWGLADGGVVFVDLTVVRAGHVPPSTPKPIDFFDLKTGQRTRLSDIRNRLFALLPSLAVSPDGRLVVYDELDYSNIDIYMMR
jgi:Tol biopolymer transport system component/DNA-binding winged helix-turn-helix (wHTH) protein